MKENPFLDLAVFPDSPVDPMTLRTHLERTRQGHEITVNLKGKQGFMLSFNHREEDGRRVVLKIRGVVDERNLGSLLPAPVACFFYEKDELKPSKSFSLYTARPSSLLGEEEGRRYLSACARAWEFISIHSTLRRGDL